MPEGVQRRQGYFRCCLHLHLAARNLFVSLPFFSVRFTDTCIITGGCFITSNYAGQLDDEEIARWPKIGSDVEVNQVTGPRPL
jgi:hypothetical protein